MGKRSDFARIERDFYPTPESAVLPLIPHLAPGTRFIEPCAGNGALVRWLGKHGVTCQTAFDIEPADFTVERRDAMSDWFTCGADVIITNPPWARPILHPMIEHLSARLPTWLLFDADWMHTRQSAPLMPLCRKIVSVGRVKWFPDTTMTGKDNAAWYLFDRSSEPAQTLFFGR